MCSGLEPGGDGVGDYTLRLAGEFIRQGHESIAIAINDGVVSVKRLEIQETAGTEVSVLRLPDEMTWSDRLTEAQDRLLDFRADWISLQFVPFGFQRKGLCFGLGKRLAGIGGKASWHIMFHELWLGMEIGTPVKNRFWGILQRSIVRDIIRRLHPRVVNTHTEPYCNVLNDDIVPASFLPLFCNVPVVEGDGWTGFLEPMVAHKLGEKADRSNLYLAGIFGSVYSEWKAYEAVETLFPLTQQAGKRLMLIFFGRSGLSDESMSELKLSVKGRADVIFAGEMSAPEISKVIQTLDLGLATSPWQAIQKSSSVATLLFHGVPVAVTRDDWRLPHAGVLRHVDPSRLISPEEFKTLRDLPTRRAELSDSGSVRSAVEKMLALFADAAV